MKKIIAGTIDEYIADFPPDVQQRLEEMRAAIRKAAPEAKEAIKYGLPTFVLNGNLVHFGGFKNHIGFYPAPMGLEAFRKELSAYKGAKGSVQFPLDRPLPLALVEKMVKFRIMKNAERAKEK
ncbi:MAG: DUF1801 domain-containing protein [Puia sp.]|nr:DUF1801 domain-containing protein [Puia sp.]